MIPTGPTPSSSAASVRCSRGPRRPAPVWSWSARSTRSTTTPRPSPANLAVALAEVAGTRAWPIWICAAPCSASSSGRRTAWVAGCARRNDLAGRSDGHRLAGHQADPPHGRRRTRARTARPCSSCCRPTAPSDPSATRSLRHGSTACSTRWPSGRTSSSSTARRCSGPRTPPRSRSAVDGLIVVAGVGAASPHVLSELGDALEGLVPVLGVVVTTRRQVVVRPSSGPQRSGRSRAGHSPRAFGCGGRAARGGRAPPPVVTAEDRPRDPARRLSILIVSYECRDLLLRCLDSIPAGAGRARPRGDRGRQRVARRHRRRRRGARIPTCVVIASREPRASPGRATGRSSGRRASTCCCSTPTPMVPRRRALARGRRARSTRGPRSACSAASSCSPTARSTTACKRGLPDPAQLARATSPASAASRPRSRRLAGYTAGHVDRGRDRAWSTRSTARSCSSAARRSTRSARSTSATGCTWRTSTGATGSAQAGWPVLYWPEVEVRPRQGR